MMGTKMDKAAIYKVNGVVFADVFAQGLNDAVIERLVAGINRPCRVVDVTWPQGIAPSRLIIDDAVLSDWSLPFVFDVAPPDPAVVRAGMRLSFAQLLIGLVAEKWITDAEGEAWLEANLPAALQAVIATLPQEHQFPARARALRPSQIERLDPMVDMLGAAQRVSPEGMDEFFTKYMAV